MEVRVTNEYYAEQCAKGRRPLRILMLTTVRPDFAFVLAEWGMILERGRTYFATTNQHGAACGVCLCGNDLGVKPEEFEVTIWQEPKGAHRAPTVSFCVECGTAHFDNEDCALAKGLVH